LISIELYPKLTFCTWCITILAWW